MNPPYPPEDLDYPLGEEEELILKPFVYEEEDCFEPNSGMISLHLFCHDRKSNSVAIRINNFRVYCCIALPEYSLNQNLPADGDYKKATYSPNTFISWDYELAKKVFMILCQKQANSTSRKTDLPKEPPFDFYFNYFNDIYYYTGKKKPYLYLFFNSLAARADMMHTIMYPIYIQGEGYIQFEMHENKIPTFRRLMSKRNTKYTQWMSVKGRKVPINSKYRVMKPTVNEYIVNFETITQIDESISAKWFVYPKMFSWDGEMYSKNHKQMPHFKRPHDAIYMISVIFQYMEHVETRRKVCLVYGSCDDIEGVEVVRFKSERDLLLAFCHLFNYFDPDLVIGYNTSSFDYPYVIGRFERNDIAIEDIPSTGRLLNKKTSIYEMNWSSSGAGKNSITLIKHEGRIPIDMLPNIRRLYKLRQYTLQFVSMKYLGKGKNDVKAKDMFKIYEDSIGENKGVLTKMSDGVERVLTMTDVAAYCVQDSILPIELFDNRKLWYHLSSLSSAAGVSILELFTRGEQIRCYSNIADECYKQGIILSNPQYFDYYFKGGFVGKPKPGVYKYVFTLDFASLYPSIMRAYNISIDAIIKISDWTKFDPDDYEINYFEQEEPADFVSVSYRKDLEEKYKILLKQNQLIQEYQDFMSNGKIGSYASEQDYIKMIRRHAVQFTQDDFTTMHYMGMKDAKKLAFNPDNPDESISYDPEYFEDKNDLAAGGPLYGGKQSVTRRYEIRIIKKKIHEGIMSLLETNWFFKRKDIKKLMKKCENALKKKYDKNVDAERDVHNAGQNAVKIMMNSGYGFNGVSKGMLPALPVAILVTAIGRRLIGIVNELLVEKFAHYGAKIVYNDTDSSMIALDIKDEDVLSGKVNLEEIMEEMEETTNGRPEKFIYNDDATVKEIIIERKEFNESLKLNKEIINYDKIEYVLKTIKERSHFEKETGKNQIVKERTFYNEDGSIKEIIEEFIDIDKALVKELSPPKKIYHSSEYIKEKITEKIEINDEGQKELIIEKTIYNRDATIKKVISDIEPIFRDELQMECENCTQMCPLKPKYYIKAHRETNLAKILKNGFFKKDHEGNIEITTKGILTSKKGNSQFANIVYDGLVNQVIFIHHTVEMLYTLSKQMCDFLSDKFPVKDLCRVTELGSDYKQEGYFMNVFANYLTSQGMPVKPGDRLEYIIVRTANEVATGKTENVGLKCREYSMWEADPNKEIIDYSYYIEKGLQEQFDNLFSVGNMNVINDPRLAEVGYQPQFSRCHFVHFKTPIKMISALVKDYMKLSDEEFIRVYTSYGRDYDPKYPRNFYIAIILDTFMDRICKFIQGYYPMDAI